MYWNAFSIQAVKDLNLREIFNSSFGQNIEAFDLNTEVTVGERKYI